MTPLIRLACCFILLFSVAKVVSLIPEPIPVQGKAFLLTFYGVIAIGCIAWLIASIRSRTEREGD